MSMLTAGKVSYVRSLREHEKLTARVVVAVGTRERDKLSCSWRQGSATSNLDLSALGVELLNELISATQVL